LNPDIVGTMTDMSAVADASVDALFSSHNIEHLYPHEVPVALAEFRGNGVRSFIMAFSQRKIKEINWGQTLI
jgi:hypothetical protein